MGKLYDRLQKQLEFKEYKKAAEDCLNIYEKLKEISASQVWGSEWDILKNVSGEIGERPNTTIAYKPSQIGYIFLKDVELTKES
ncbi:MAG: hypothetical protein RR406_04880 [Bacilli bacterium]